MAWVYTGRRGTRERLFGREVALTGTLMITTVDVEQKLPPIHICQSAHVAANHILTRQNLDKAMLQYTLPTFPILTLSDLECFLFYVPVILYFYFCCLVM